MLKLLAEQRILSRQGDTWTVDLALLQPGQTNRRFIPPTVWEVIQTRLARLADQPLALLTAAAILGRGATFPHLCRVAQLDDSPGLSALDDLLRGHLLVEADTPLAGSGDEVHYLFTRDLIRAIVYDMAGEARRRIFHRRAFEALEQAAASHPEPGRRAAELAYHALAGGLKEATFRYSLAAGDDAMHLFAIRDAISHYEQARTLITNLQSPISNSSTKLRTGLQSLIAHLHLQLGRAYELNDDWTQARDVYETLLQYARAAGNPSLECQALNRLATVYIHGLIDLKQATALLEEALAVATTQGYHMGIVETHWNLALVARWNSQNESARQYAEQALEMARQLQQPELIARSLNISIYLNLRLRRWAAAIACGEEALEYFVAIGDQIMEADCRRAISWARVFRGELPAAVQALQTAYAMSQKTENLWGQTDCACKLAQALLETGAYGEAFRLAEHGVALARDLGNPHLIALNLMTLGSVQRAMLLLDSARESQRQAIAAQATVPAPIFPDWALAELCAIAALSGDWAAAHTYARQSLTVREAKHLLPIVLTFWYEIEALLRGGVEALARAEIERLDTLIGDNRRYRLPYLRSLAVLAGWDGNREQAITHLQEALTLAEAIGLPGEQWSILAKLGELHRANGNEEQAQHALGKTADIIQALAATIDDEGLQAEFLGAEPNRQLFKRSA